MEFNAKKKFQVIRYGRNTDLKENTEYFVGDYPEVIERFSSLRDLGIEVIEKATLRFILPCKSDYHPIFCLTQFVT